MTFTIIYMILALFAILIMGYCIYLGVVLFGEIKGGIVKKRIQILTVLLVFFFLGYLGMSLMQLFGGFEFSTMLVYLIFFFGAIFVYIAINTIKSILKVSGIIQK